MSILKKLAVGAAAALGAFAYSKRKSAGVIEAAPEGAAEGAAEAKPKAKRKPARRRAKRATAKRATV